MFLNRTFGNTHLQQSKKRSLKKNVLYTWEFQFLKNFLHCNLLLKILYAGSFIAKLICCWRKVLWNKLEGRSAGQSHGIFIHEPKPSASIIIITIIITIAILFLISGSTQGTIFCLMPWIGGEALFFGPHSLQLLPLKNKCWLEQTQQSGKDHKI